LRVNNGTRYQNQIAETGGLLYIVGERSSKKPLWELDEIAKYFHVSRKTARMYVKQVLHNEFHLRRRGWAVKIEITSDQMQQLIAVKRPMYGTNPAFDSIYERNYFVKRKASQLGNLAKRVKRLKEGGNGTMEKYEKPEDPKPDEPKPGDPDQPEPK